jgi:histidinol-phosphatase (PHP family)
VLTDYHVHLRSDELAASADRHFTEANAERYRLAASERGIAELGASEHVYRFEQALAVWRHPFWVENARDDLEEYCAFVRERTDLRLGIEADFVPGREPQMASLLAGYDFDYVIGSVHFVAEGAVDMDDYSVWEGPSSPEEIWRRYFQTLGEAARSGLFDVLGPSRSGEGLGAWTPPAGGRPAPLLRAGDGRDRGIGHRGGDFHRGAAQAGGGALPSARVPRDVPPGRR